MGGRNETGEARGKEKTVEWILENCDGKEGKGVSTERGGMVLVLERCRGGKHSRRGTQVPSTHTKKMSEKNEEWGGQKKGRERPVKWGSGREREDPRER